MAGKASTFTAQSRSAPLVTAWATSAAVLNVDYVKQAHLFEHAHGRFPIVLCSRYTGMTKRQANAT